MKFSLNHMVAPARGHEAFFDIAESLDIPNVEIRNDIPSSRVEIADARAIRGWAGARAVTIVSVNALQRFNQWGRDRAEEAKALAAYAAAAGAGALVLCPTNDPAYRPERAERLSRLREALAGLAPILADQGVKGLVEPLGFAECSLRLKSEAIAAIDEVGASGTFAVVHDTFHHFVAGETEMFPQWTGLVHISGVVDRTLTAASMRDPHRVLVTADDMIDNVGQLRKLAAGGYAGVFSFEPFAASVHGSPDIVAELWKSRDYVATA
jgi:2-keto-myo-inositol isomerase